MEQHNSFDVVMSAGRWFARASARLDGADGERPGGGVRGGRLTAQISVRDRPGLTERSTNAHERTE